MSFGGSENHFPSQKLYSPKVFLLQLLLGSGTGTQAVFRDRISLTQTLGVCSSAIQKHGSISSGSRVEAITSLKESGSRLQITIFELPRDSSGGTTCSMCRMTCFSHLSRFMPAYLPGKGPTDEIALLCQNLLKSSGYMYLLAVMNPN